MRELRDVAALLKRLGHEPATIIDVGVATGTPELYRAWPEAYLVLVEPLPPHRKGIEGILSRRSGEAHEVALSDAPGTVSVEIDPTPERLAQAEVIDAPKGGTDRFEIDVRRLDDLPLARDVPEGSLLKVDAQTGDLRVLRGAAETLRRCDVVIAEASLYSPRNLVRDIVNHMDDAGFRLFEIFGHLARAHDGAQGQVDLAFVRKGHPIIAHESW